MAKLGTNLRCVADVRFRDAVALFYTKVFDAKVAHPMPELDVYALGGSNIGVYFVPNGEALTPEQHNKVGTWIEVVVDDVEATAALLRDLGHPRVDYHDKERRYYQVPGGQVFRLAQQS